MNQQKSSIHISQVQIHRLYFNEAITLKKVHDSSEIKMHSLNFIDTLLANVAIW